MPFWKKNRKPYGNNGNKQSIKINVQRPLSETSHEDTPTTTTTTSNNSTSRSSADSNDLTISKVLFSTISEEKTMNRPNGTIPALVHPTPATSAIKKDVNFEIVRYTHSDNKVTCTRKRRNSDVFKDSSWKTSSSSMPSSANHNYGKYFTKVASLIRKYNSLQTFYDFSGDRLKNFFAVCILLT